MKRTGAQLVVYALEQLGIQYTFGIPGVHNTEIYDALAGSDLVLPVLTTHEGGAAFMADGLSRTSDGVGTLVIVPAAGTTHAMSGIGEAFLDGVPMLVISGGTRRDSNRKYQLHQLDLGKLTAAIVKEYILVREHRDIVPSIFRAYVKAVSGEPGPVFVEIPVELQLFQGDIPDLPVFEGVPRPPEPDLVLLREAAEILRASKRPGIYVGWGAVNASAEVRELAEFLVAPVATTLQGLSSFPADHPFHVGMGFGASASPAARRAFSGCDCLLAVGLRFAELATGSYGMDIPVNLIHIDINPEVFHQNYPARLAIQGDAREALSGLIHELKRDNWESMRSREKLSGKIQKDKTAYFQEWAKSADGKLVSPYRFFSALRERLPEDALLVTDDGKHTFLAAELFAVRQAGGFISPTDFNCMGYCVPAAIGAKIAKPDRPVAAIVGDGAFLMTGMEILTAVNQGLGILFFVFHDGELGQISQFQKIPLNRKTCTVLGDYRVEGFALATGAKYLAMEKDSVVEEVLDQAFELTATDRPVIVDVRIDYSKRTLLTKGTVRTNLSRFPLREKLRFLGRAAKRHLLDRTSNE